MTGLGGQENAIEGTLVVGRSGIVAGSAIYPFLYNGFLTFGMAGMKLRYPTPDDQVLAEQH